MTLHRLRMTTFRLATWPMTALRPTALRSTMLLITTLLLVGLPAVAQTVEIEGPQANRKLLMMGLYPPDIIMRHQQALGVTPAQRKRMLTLVKEFQSEVAELQWNLQNEQQLMRQSIGEKTIDAKQALPQVEKVLQMESEFKLAHFKLLIAIKNELTEEQIDMIRQRVREMRQRSKS